MSIISAKNDPLGTAISDYYNTSDEEDILVQSDIASDDIIRVSYLFRTFETMPELEQQALKLCKGKVLDVGAAAGCHSLVLQEKGVDITALEISDLCCYVMQKRGIRKVICDDFFRFEEEKFDTILMMMNGIGIAGTLEGLDDLLKKANSLLLPGGQVIFDSSNIEYLYIEKDGSRWIDLNSNYYGELIYTMRYKEIQGSPFQWLFIDFDTLAPMAKRNGFEPKLFAIGNHYDYLGILKKE